MKKLILHIGSEKTGTSSVQRFMSANHDTLRSKNIIYPSIDNQENHSILALSCSNNTSDFNNFNSFLAEDYITKLRAEVDSAGDGSTILLSSEHFHSRCTGDGIRTLSEKLKELNLEVYKVILYLRDQASLASSSYCTSVLCGNVNDFDISSVTPENYYFNYFELTKSWANVFGKKNITIRPYNNLEHGVIFDFLREIGLKDNECREIISSSKAPQERVHESINPSKLEIIKIMSRKGISITDDLVRMIRLSPLRDTYSHYDLNDVIFIKSIFDPINAKMCKYFSLKNENYPSITIEEIRKAHLKGKGQVSISDLTEILSTVWNMFTHPEEIYSHISPDSYIVNTLS